MKKYVDNLNYPYEQQLIKYLEGFDDNIKDLAINMLQFNPFHRFSIEQ